MKVVLFCGGLGTRLGELTEDVPKPMVKIGYRPILWHIMKYYAHYGHKEFFVAVGYKAEVIKNFFMNYAALNSTLTVDLTKRQMEMHDSGAEDWIVHLIDTGMDTNTGGRLKRLRQWLGNETFMITYGDGVCSVDLNKLLEFHHSHGLVGTVTAVRPPARFGSLLFDGNRVSSFTEKPQIGEGWINGGFFVFEPAIFDYLDDDRCSLEVNALEKLAADRQLAAYKHEDFWQCMDTLRDKNLLERLWLGGQPPWKAWK